MGQLTHTTTEVDEQLDGVYAEIYCDDNTTTQSIANGASYVKVTNFNTNGDSSHCTADQANDKVTITKEGEYKVEANLSFTGNTGNVNWFGSIFFGGVEAPDIHFERKLGSGGDYGSTSIGGLHSIEVGDLPLDVDVRFRHDNGSANDLTLRYANINVVRVGI
jgi:hypothetical protein